MPLCQSSELSLFEIWAALITMFSPESPLDFRPVFSRAADVSSFPSDRGILNGVRLRCSQDEVSLPGIGGESKQLRRRAVAAPTAFVLFHCAANQIAHVSLSEAGHRGRGPLRVSRVSHCRHFQKETCGTSKCFCPPPSSAHSDCSRLPHQQADRSMEGIPARQITSYGMGGEGEIVLKPNICALSVCPTKRS
jgi:hypothetical protein